MNIEALIKILGGFGRYQLTKYILLLIFCIYDGIQTLSLVFVAAETEFECKFDHRNLTDDFLNITESDIRSLTTIPGDSCRIFNASDAVLALSTTARNISAAKSLMANYSSMECTYGYNFLPGEFASSVVSDFELVCEREILRTIAQACYFVGKFVGFVLTGRLADRFGRKKIFIVCIVVTSFFGVASAAAPNIYFFYTCFVLYGSLGGYSIAFTLATELVDAKHRLVTGMGIHTFFSIGYILLSPIAYFIQNWRYLLVAINAPCLLLLSYWWFLDESLRWLLMKEKDEEASNLLQKIAKTNRKALPDNILVQVKSDLLPKKDDHKKKSLLDLFKNRRIAISTLIIWYIWIVSSMVYYGLSLNSSNLAGSTFVNLTLTAAVEIPSYAFAILANRTGRKRLLVVSMLASGVSCILAGVLEDRLLVVAFSLVGKFTITAAYSIIYTYTAEFFPTDVRNLAVAASAMVSKFGSISSPFIVQLHSAWEPLPLIVFGVVGLIASGLSFILPETTGRPLSQTISEMFTKKTKSGPGAEEDIHNTDC